MHHIFKIFLVFGILTNFSFSQVHWNLDYNSANFAFLKLDYTSYNFEGGYFTKFNYHSGIDNDSIPFNIVYIPPLDYGNISFAYSPTNETIFAATIIWAGQGHMTFPDPDSIQNPYLFNYDSLITVVPYSIEYYKYILPDSVFYPKADSAWLSVKKLSILRKFGEEGSIFRVGIYLYAPAVGEFNPYVAKWIIFLYRGQLITSVDENKIIRSYKLFQNYPNPFNPTTIIKWEIPKAHHVIIKIYNVIGQEMRTLIDEQETACTHQKEFNASNLPSGVYFYRMQAGKYIETKKMIILK